MNVKLLPAMVAMLGMLAADLPTSSHATPAPATPAPVTAASGLEITLNPTAPRWQAGTLAQVVGYRLGTEMLFDGVVVFNGSNSTLTEVRVGCILEATLPGDSASTRLALVNTSPIPVNIAPNGVGAVSPLPWTYDSIIAILIALQAAGPIEVTAVLGITGAEWQNGRTYSRSISKGFREKPNARLDARFGALDINDLYLALEAIPAVPPPGDGATSGGVINTCREAPGWMCAFSVFNPSQCIGSAMCPNPLLCSSKCVALRLP